LGIVGLSLDLIFSYLFAPFSYLLGFSGDEAFTVGKLLGTKLTINEFVAYAQLVKENLSERTIAVVTYALCGFANFSSIGIQIGGIGALVPSKREMLGQYAMLALLGGSLSNLLSAMIAALLL
jgi:concentrative nucleoside transporter, CNT family